MNSLTQNSRETCIVCVYCLSVYRTLFTNDLICSLNSPIFVNIGVLEVLLGIEQVNGFFGGPRLQTGSANRSLSCLRAGQFPSGIPSLAGSLSIPCSIVLSDPNVYSQTSWGASEEQGFRLISESSGLVVVFCRLFLRCLSSIEDPFFVHEFNGRALDLTPALLVQKRFWSLVNMSHTQPVRRIQCHLY